ncbi:hypothetical protein ACF1BK_03485 [Streptomyces globisporus]|uniref:hypothetical protein n=1 Tax=Streptomyces globisporus TaxID=1908 RepID=UPI0036F83319
MRTQGSELLGFAHEAGRLGRVHIAQGGIPFSGVVVGNGRNLGTGVGHVADHRTVARFGFARTSTYSLFAQDSPDRPIKVTTLQLSDADKSFQGFITQSRAG